MAFIDQYNFFDLGLFGLFEQNPPLDPLCLSTIDETLCTSLYSFNTPTLSDSNQFQPLANVQTFGFPTPPLDYHMSVIPPQDVKMEKSRKKGNAGKEELIADPHDDKHLARMLSRKRAQNRAAQIAFRQKREKYVKELEERIADVEAAQQKLSAENEQLNESLHRLNVENKILLFAQDTGHDSSLPKPAINPVHDTAVSLPEAMVSGSDKNVSYLARTLNESQRVLTVGDAWEHIICHHSFMRGFLDLAGIIQQLKYAIRQCGYSGVILENAIIRIMDEEPERGTDYLI